MKRSEQLKENTWDLEMMYNPNNLDKDLVSLHQQVKKISSYQDRELDKETIINALDDYYKFMCEMENIYVYFSHNQDTDFGNDQNIAIFNMVKGEYNKMMVTLSFLFPSIAKADGKVLKSILTDEKLVAYHKTIRNILLNKKRYLSAKEEKIISTYAANDGATQSLYSSFTNSDMKFSSIVDSLENKFDLTESNYSNYIRANDRILRKNAFESLLGEYKKYNQTLSTNYISKLKQAHIKMQVRSYDSTLQQALEPNEIPLIVYHNLLEAVENNIKTNHEYMLLRKQALGLEELNLYDVYVPIVSEIEQKYPYEKAKQLVQEAFKIFDTEYQDVIEQALTNRWIDVYENEGKRSGAYSGGSYQSVPYMLLNYTDELNDVFTLAHELGHSMHSYFANENNQYQNANYKIFIAEVASTVNELILINYLLKNEKDVKTRKYLYNYLLEQFRTTLIRQTMFARFELESHRLVENNSEISNAILNELYYDINKKYFGNDININELIKYEWSRIPHFYYNYYVYQYATSFSISLNIVERILNKEKDILTKYMDFLKLGDSVYPIEALKVLDIDLTTTATFDKAMHKYQETLEMYKNVK